MRFSWQNIIFTKKHLQSTKKPPTWKIILYMKDFQMICNK